MKKESNWLSILLLGISTIIIVCIFSFTLHKKTYSSKNVLKLKDSLGRLKESNTYIKKLLHVEFTENKHLYSFDSSNLYILVDGRHKPYKSVAGLFKEGRKKLVLRYTEIGCNACADSTIKILKVNKNIPDNYDIVVLVDFTNYDAYLKWRKISDFTFPVFYVAKGNLPFEIEQQ